MIREGLQALRGIPGLLRFKDSTAGATAVEYGLLAGLIALGIAGGIGALADLIQAVFEMLGEETQAVADGVNPEDTE